MTAVPGTVYFYWVEGTFSDGTKAFSYSSYGYRSVAGAPSSPANVVASEGVEDQKYVQISWDTSAGASFYRVFRASEDNFAKAIAISGDIIATEFLDSSAAPGIRFYYWIQAKNATGWSNYSQPDIGYMPALLIAYYNMNELDSTNMFDSSDNAFDGIYRDDPILGITSEDTALFGTAVEFDVSDAVINSNSPICNLTNNFSIAMWIKPTEILSDASYLFSFDSDVAGWQIYSNDRYLNFSLTDVGGTTSQNNVITNGVWTHLVVTFDHMNFARIYINGVANIGEQLIGMPANYVKSDLLIANNANDELFEGGIDEVRIYSGIISDEVIAELANVPEPTSLALVFSLILGLCLVRK